MALMPAALRVAPENIAAGDVRVAIGAKGRRPETAARCLNGRQSIRAPSFRDDRQDTASGSAAISIWLRPPPGWR
jgi:hypothetical protein